MKKIMLSIICMTLLFMFCFNINSNGEIVYAYSVFDDMTAKSYVVIDCNNNILISKDPEEKREVASICKLMTTLIILENIEKKNISLDDKYVASSYACAAEGSQAFLDSGSLYTIRDLLKSVIVASANDSAIVLAEGIAGSESNFAELMNNRARELGMTNTKYANATGLHENGEQYSTSFDTAILLSKVSEYDIYKEYSNIWMDKLIHPSGRETELVNTNRLIKYYPNCKTGKTGYTDEAGYCLSSTAEKDNMKLTCVVLGASSSANRFKESMELYNYAYANFTNKKIIDKNSYVDNNIKVVGGIETSIYIVPESDYYLTQNRVDNANYEIKYQLIDCIKAPIMAGDCVGKILVIVDGKIIGEINVVAVNDVPKQSYVDILSKIIGNFSVVR